MTGAGETAKDARAEVARRLPPGEATLWQGRPGAWTLARDAMALYWVAGWFALLAAWKLWTGLADGGAAQGLALALPYLGLGAIACLIVLAIAWVQARAATYTITTARVVLRVGAVLPVTFNLPFRQIGAANLDLRRDGSGTIAFETLGDTRLSYLVLWPHVRPWRTKRTEPALRSIPGAARVASLIAEAAETRVSEPVVRVAPPRAVAAE